MKSLFAVVASALLFTACAPLETSGPAPDAGTRITLVRSLCFGFCPDYTVTINGDGRVEYEGRRFVRVKGRQTGTASRDEVANLLAQFERAHFFDLRDEYRAQITDIPTYTIEFVHNGRTKRVVDYGGPGAGMPEAVRDLENAIDRVANTAQWTRSESGELVREP